MQPRTAPGLKKEPTALRLKIVEPDRLFDRMRQLHEAITARAYEFFEARGGEMGHDMEDWLRAESEMLRDLRVEIADAGDTLKLSAEVPGFSADEIAISVEPNRVLLSGRKERAAQKTGENLVYSEKHADEFFRALDLPAEVLPAKTEAHLEDGMLRLTLPKAQAAPPAETDVMTE